MIGPIILGMILKTSLMLNYRYSVTANSSLLSPTGGVKSIPPETENSMQYGYDENDNNNNMSNKTKRETNYSMNKWREHAQLHAAHKVQLVHY